MPRKKNEELTVEEKKSVKSDVSPKSATQKATSKSPTKKASTTKSSTTTKATSRSTSKSGSSASKTNAKKTTEKKQATTKTTAKKVATAKSTAKKTSTSESVGSKTKKADTKPLIEVVEYYDLPYRYNQTVVKVLYQTPTTLFIYWDISDADRKAFVEQYGENFFNDTKPVLVVHNDTLHYSFEIEIDDFANSWYLHVNDSNCKYAVELGRRPKYHDNHKDIDIPNDYIYVTYSNEIEAPNDHVLFNRDLDTVYFKDVKTNIVTAENITSLSFMRNMGRIYSLYDLYTNFNKNNWMDNNRWQLDLTNPSSGNPSSTFK